MSKSRNRRAQRRAKRESQPTKPDPKPDAPAEPVEAEVVNEETAIAPRKGGALGDLYTPSPLAVLSDDAFEERLQVLVLEQKRIEQVKRAILIEDTEGDGSGDYGVIPGTKKPSLYQSGAEKFNRLFRLRPVYRRTRVEGDGSKTPHFRYLVECDLVDETGSVVGTGAGSCSNFEVKYRYRNAGLVCPDCGQTEIRVSKFEDSPGYYCWKKPEQGHDGCGAKFPPGDQRIESQTVGRIDNPDPHDCENTVQQMADKRAYVKATRTTHALSNTFTQESGGEGAHGPANEPPPPDERERQDSRAQRAGRTKITEGQLGAARERMKERAKTFGDAGVSWNEIEVDLAKAFKVKALADLDERDMPNLMKAIGNWQPPASG